MRPDTEPDRASATSPRRVIGYFTSYSRNTGLSELNLDFSIITHVAHFSVLPLPDGSLELPRFGPFPDPDLLAYAHARGVPVLLTAGSDHEEQRVNFSAMAAKPDARARFVRELVALVVSEGYDGIDIDWEFPINVDDRANMTALIRELRATLPQGALLTVVTPSTDYFGEWYDIQALLPLVDWVHAMGYPIHGPGWSDRADHTSPLYATAVDGAYARGTGPSMSVDYTQRYWLGRGVPRDKLVVGLPFFGQRYDGASSLHQPLWNRNGGRLNYNDVVRLIGNDWTAKFDPVAQAPYLERISGAGVITYDDAASIAAKCHAIAGWQVGGAFLWHLGQDDLESAQPLLQAARICRGSP